MIPFPQPYSQPAPTPETAEQPEPVKAAPGLLAHIRAARAERLQQEAQRPKEPWQEPAPWINPRWLLWAGLAVLAVAYVQREMKDAAPTRKSEPAHEATVTESTYACPEIGALQAAERMVLFDRNPVGANMLLQARKCEPLAIGERVHVIDRRGSYRAISRGIFRWRWVLASALEPTKVAP